MARAGARLFCALGKTSYLHPTKGSTTIASTRGQMTCQATLYTHQGRKCTAHTAPHPVCAAELMTAASILKEGNAVAYQDPGTGVNGKSGTSCSRDPEDPDIQKQKTNTTTGTTVGQGQAVQTGGRGCTLGGSAP